MDKQGNKTGGRQKGTPNKVNASIKVRIKDFLIKTEDAMMDAFMRAKPNERLNFWFKMANFICAKQTSSKDDGEWRPGEGINAEWSTNDEWFQNEMNENYKSLMEENQRNRKMMAQAIQAKLYNECKQAISALTPEEAKRIMQLFPNEEAGKDALYTTLKSMLDIKIDKAIEQYGNFMTFNEQPAQQPTTRENNSQEDVPAANIEPANSTEMTDPIAPNDSTSPNDPTAPIAPNNLSSSAQAVTNPHQNPSKHLSPLKKAQLKNRKRHRRA